MLQWPRPPRSRPKNPRFSNSVSSRSVFARRCSRDTATLEGWITRVRSFFLALGRFSNAGVPLYIKNRDVQALACTHLPDDISRVDLVTTSRCCLASAPYVIRGRSQQMATQPVFNGRPCAFPGAGRGARSGEGGCANRHAPVLAAIAELAG